MNTYDAVKQAIQPDVAKVGPLPPLLDPVVTLFSKAHLYYRSFKMGRTFQKAATDPEKGNAAAYGAALHLASDYTSLEYALKVALVVKCSEDLLKGYRQVSEKTQTFWDAARCRYPLYQPIEWGGKDKKSSPTFLSPSYFVNKLVQLSQFSVQMHRVATALPSLLWQAFKLSMSVSDAYLVLNGDEAARFECFTELVSEWDSYQNLLEEDKERLVEVIENGSAVADRILKKLKIPETCATLVKSLKGSLAKGAPDDVSGLLKDFVEVAKDALDPVLIKGKITPFHLDFSEGAAAPSALPKGKFPPWGGQKVKPAAVPKKKKSDAKKGDDWVTQASKALKQNPVIGQAYQGLQTIAGAAKGLLTDPLGAYKGANPFV